MFAGAVLAAAGCIPVVAEQPREPQQTVATQTELFTQVARMETGTRATFTVHVSPLKGNADGRADAAVVTILEGSKEIGSALLNADGDATVESSALPPGTHSVHAVFNGSGRLAGSASPEREVTAEATGAAGFLATASPTALNVTQGNSVSTTITFTPQNGFSNYVSLSCSSLPPDSTCTFLPVNVFVSGAAATTSVLSIETYGPTGGDASLRKPTPLLLGLIFPGLLGLAGLGLRRRGRAWQNAGLVLLILACLGSSLGLMSGCSQRYHYLNRPPQASTGTPLGSTPIIIEAQAISGVVVTTDQIKNVVLTVQAPPS